MRRSTPCLFIAIGISLSGCNYDTYRLRNPKDGTVVVCESAYYAFEPGSAQLMGFRNCIDEYKNKGYVPTDSSNISNK